MEAPKATVARARRLRRRMDLPEVLLWDALRGRRLARLRFRRQHPLGPFILDFYCETARLAIEVDGYSHDVGVRPALDQRRDAALAQAGVRTLRVAARDVLGDLNGVLEAILAAAGEPPPPPFGRSPSPNGGGI